MNPIASTPEPPYYAVIFTSRRTDSDNVGYGEMADKMFALASEQPGFLGVESVRGPDGVGITVSYWESPEAIDRWGQHTEHRLAQQQGRAGWYESFRLRICRVEREVAFGRAD